MAQTRSKTRKLRQNLNDPMANLFEPLLLDLVFQHFTGREVKNLFAVSKDWNDAAMQSSKAMSMIKLKIYDFPENTSSKDLTFLVKSRRPYKHADISFHFTPNFDLKMQLLKKLSLNLEELRFRSRRPYGADSLELPSDIRFPVLKKLTLNCDSADEALIILAGTTEHLKELVLDGGGALFNEQMASNQDIASYPYPHLLIYNRNSTTKQQREENLVNFLNASSPTLQILRIGNCNAEAFEFILTKLPGLKELEVSSLKFEEAPAHIRNQSITTLEVFICYSIMSDNILKCIENLEIVIIGLGFEDGLVAVLKQAKDIKKLKKIELKGLWYGGSPHKIYQSLIDSDPKIPRGIEIVHECKNFFCCKE